MILSLYMLLAYTWNTDLKMRYKSMEINYGLSEYWAGGLTSRGLAREEKIGRGLPGKLFNDDGDDGGIVVKLMNGLGDDKLDGISGDTLASADDTVAAIMMDDASSDSSDTSIPIFLSASNTKTKRRRPQLSYAKSLQHGGKSAGIIAPARRPPPSKWTLSRLLWAMVWISFTLPIIEAAIREVRRQVNLRFLWRRRNNIVVPPTVGGSRRRLFLHQGSGRMTNVHNL